MSIDINEITTPKTFKFLKDFEYMMNLLTQPDIIAIKQKDYNEFMNMFYERDDTKDFVDKHPTFFLMLVSGNLLPYEVLEMFINNMALVETNKITQQDADKIIAEYMNNKFIYSKYGGKDKFEKFIKNKHK